MNICFKELETNFLIERFFNNGLGIGLEWNVSNRFFINAMAGYGGRDNFRII